MYFNSNKLIWCRACLGTPRQNPGTWNKMCIPQPVGNCLLAVAGWNWSRSRAMHPKLPCDCFSHYQISTVTCGLHGRYRPVCKHLVTDHSVSETGKSVMQTQNCKSKVALIKTCSFQWQWTAFALKAHVLHFWFAPHSSLTSSWQSFADKLASSMQTTSNSVNLLVTKAIAKRFSVHFKKV